LTLVLEPKKHGVKEKIMLLDRNDVSKAVGEIGWVIDSRGVIYDGHGKIVTCSVCGDTLGVDNVGSFFPGSVEPICTKFQCFLSEMAKVDERLRQKVKPPS